MGQNPFLRHLADGVGAQTCDFAKLCRTPVPFHGFALAQHLAHRVHVHQLTVAPFQHLDFPLADGFAQRIRCHARQLPRPISSTALRRMASTAGSSFDVIFPSRATAAKRIASCCASSKDAAHPSAASASSLLPSPP